MSKSNTGFSNKKIQILLVVALTAMVGFNLVSRYMSKQTYSQGAIMYTNFCANCHMEDGSGLVGNIPPLAQADYFAEDPSIMTCIINKGMEGEIVVNGVTYDQPMAAIPQLSEFEITNIINYISTSWGNDYPIIKLEQVRKRLNEECPR